MRHAFSAGVPLVTGTQPTGENFSSKFLGWPHTRGGCCYFPLVKVRKNILGKIYRGSILTRGRSPVSGVWVSRWEKFVGHYRRRNAIGARRRCRRWWVNGKRGYKNNPREFCQIKSNLGQFTAAIIVIIYFHRIRASAFPNPHRSCAARRQFVCPAFAFGAWRMTELFHVDH